MPRLESAQFIVSSAQLALDAEMMTFDIWGTRAHVIMLCSTGIIPPEAGASILSALDKIDAEVDAGTYQIDPERGAQLSLEKAVIALAGTTDGSRMHTARSRNDQVMTTEMLHLRARALSILAEASSLVGTLLALAEEHIGTIMPGYTHMQPAKPTTFGQWALAYADALLRNLSSLQNTWDEFDASPLGAVESYGTSWPIDRSLTASLLGFSRVWEVPQDAIASRGMPQLAYLDMCKNIALTLSKITADLLLFTTWEYNYLRLGEAVAQRLHPITGSSVMPQKRNPDALELLRATTQEIVSVAGAAANLLAGLPMGYNRDTRQIKEWSALGFGKTQEALHMLSTVLSTVWVDRDRMLWAVKANYSSSTDLADMVAQASGVGYRQVYAVVGKLVDQMIQEDHPLYTITANAINEAAQQAAISLNITDEQIQAALDPYKAVAARKHIGGSAAPEMKRLLQARQSLLSRHILWSEQIERSISVAHNNTLSRSQELQASVQGVAVS